MPVPSREEIIAYARQVAEKYGLDPETFLTVINGESGFNPAARGDYEGGVAQSGGVVQLYNKGLGPKFTQMTGMDPFNPESAFQAIDFMGREVAQGGQGYEPWHAAKRAGIGQFQGVPGQQAGTPGNQGRRDRGVAPMPSPTWGQQPGISSVFAPEKDEGRSRMTTVGGLLAQKVGLNPTQRPEQSLLGAVLELGGVTPTGKAKQREDLMNKATKADRGRLGSMETNLREKPAAQPGFTLANVLFGTDPEEQKKTLGQGFFGLFG